MTLELQTIKLVVIGDSGVGKTSLRGQVSLISLGHSTPPCFEELPDAYSTNSQIDSSLLQYTSGRFSTGYRATIGADFITKTLPDPIGREEDPGVALQIWVRSALVVN